MKNQHCSDSDCLKLQNPVKPLLELVNFNSLAVPAMCRRLNYSTFEPTQKANLHIHSEVKTFSLSS